VPLAVFSSAAMGASQGVFMALTSTYVQSIAPDRLRSRISSLYILHAGGIMAFANLGYGFMADVFSAPPILLVTAVIFLVIMLVLSRSQLVLRQVYRTGDVVLG
ncbi:MAG: MFS transporter, partial [SAR202 cluster bacterium]|nr:MFS transporter [SAR202 cluster bacterium]